MRRCCVLGITFTVLAVVSSPLLPCLAQESEGLPATTPINGAPGRPDQRNLREMLEQVSYDPTEQGPLLAIAPGAFVPKRPLPPKERPVPSLGAIAAAASRRVVRAGAVTLLAPEQMTLLNTNPGRPNLLIGLPEQQRKIAFLSTLTMEQWKIAGGPGIGRADLTPDQQEMFDTLLLPRFRVITEKITAVEDDPTGRVRGGEILGEKEYDRNAVRLRFQRKTTYSFYETGKQEAEHSGPLFQDPKVGATVQTLDNTIHLDNAGSGSEEEGMAFGVPLRQVVPNRLKPSELDYASPGLNVLVLLTADLKTVRDVLSAVSKRTGLELHADRRVADLPVFLRFAPNQGARAGDLLMALAWGVTGTYRRMDAAVFLLTDDTEGIGTRVARLALWKNEADVKRRQLLEKGIENAARQKPLPYLKYPKEVAGALSDDHQRRIEEEWTKTEGYGAPVTFRTSELPSSVREDIQDQMRGLQDLWAEFDLEPVNLDTSRVAIGMELQIAYVMPDGTTVDMEHGEVGNVLSQLLSVAQKKTPGLELAVPSAPLKPLLSTLTRAVVLLAAPTPEEAPRLMTAARRRGFTEVWIQILLRGADKPDTVSLAAAVTAGKKVGIKVYAAVSLLRGDGIGAPERNILGQDGDALADATVTYIQRVYGGSPDMPPVAMDFVRWEMGKFRGWVALSPAEQKIRERQVLSLAAVPGLAGITFRHTGVLGNTGEVNAMRPNTAMGYTPTQRLAFLRQESYDPVDISGEDDIAPLPFFPTEVFKQRSVTVGNKGVPDTSYVPAPTAWWRFREARNRDMLVTIHSSLKKAYPALPLYIEDRASSYASTVYSWYGSWDVAHRLPKNAEGIESEEGKSAALARKASKTILLNLTQARVTDNSLGAGAFAGAVGFLAAEAVRRWDGMVIDLSELPVADALRLLNSIPARP
jgi:hypothetical protein